MREQNNSKKKGLTVEVRNGNVEAAIRKFKRKVQNSGIIQEVRERQYYEKPTSKRKRKKAAARNRWLKKVEKMNAQWW